MSITYPGSAFVGVECSTNFWFMSHTFDSRYARKLNKGSKDSDDSLDSKKMTQKKPVGLAPRAR